MDTPTTVAPKAKGKKVAWLVAAIVLIGVIVALNNVGKNAGEDVVKDDVSAVEGATTTEDGVTTRSDNATLVVSTDVDLALPYTSAYAKYAGRRMQFDSRCQASPATLTVADGTKVMLDNRGSMTNRVVVGDKAYEISAYNFSFVTLTTGTYAVSCGSNTNAATITVTK